jgi:hypothetical protein
MNLIEYKAKYGRISNKCEICGKHYKLPQWYIDEIRERMCFTCECREKLFDALGGAFRYNRNEKL